MEENMVMENTEVTEPEEAMVPEETNGSYEWKSEKDNSFGSGMIGGAIATGLILSGIGIFKKIKTKRAAKKAAKEAAQVEEPLEDDTEE